MELSAARRIKDQIRSGLPPLLWGGAKQGGGTRGGGVETGKPTIAIGIAPDAQRLGQYRIAVRPRSNDDLSGPARDYLGRTTDGELEIRETGPIRVPDPRAVPGPGNLSSPLSMGSSVSHRSGCPGTLGFFAKPPGGEVGFVSNNHVIAAEDWGKDGDEILHPGYGPSPQVVAGFLVGNYPRLLTPGPKTVDCAFARLREGVEFDAASIGDGRKLVPEPGSLEERGHVSKIGSTTGLTWGQITAFALDDIVVQYSSASVSFNGQIEIESLDERPFSMPGDSGSLIVTRDGHPIGLLFAGSAGGGRMNTGLTYANPIGFVLDALGVTLVT
jgi:hypothetical protein